MIRFAVIMRTACFPEISYRKILVKFSTYPDPLEWVLLLEDITTTESLNQSQAACRSIDRRIWLATVSHYVRGHISGSARGGSGIPIYPKKNRQNTPKYPKFLQIYPKIIEALNTLYPKLEVSETNTYLVVLPFLAFLQMDCHYFPTITDHKERPHVSLNGKMIGYG